MAYRNKTYVAFASEDLKSYWLMKAWHENEHIDFNFFDAHDLNTARDTSTDETIRRRLRERLANAKQAVVLLSDATKLKSGQSSTFFAYEVEVIKSMGIPVIFVNLNGSRGLDPPRIPNQLGSPYYTISVSFQPKIIKFALDDYVDVFAANRPPDQKIGPHYYLASVYENLGL
jgi:hypothetical protein